MAGRRAAVVITLILTFASSLYAGEKFVSAHGEEIAYGHYLVTIGQDVSDGELAAFAGELAKTYGGRLEPYAASGFRGFAIVMRPSAARLLSEDPRVVRVEEQPTSERLPKQSAPSRPAPAHQTPPTRALRPTAVTFVPAATSSSATEPWSGPYQYDGAGNIKAIGDNVYAYDGVNRLVSATAITKAQSWTQTYQYDGFGNLLQMTVNDGTTPAAVSEVDSSTNRIDSTAPCPASAHCSFGTFDEAGNQTGANDPETSSTAILANYTYDTQNMMTDRQEGSRHDIYVYDADDQRIATVNYGSGGGTQTWHYTLRDLGANVIREVDATVTSGTASYTWKKDYVHRGSMLLAAVTPPASGSTAMVRTHLHLDHLGTPRLITDDTGMKLAMHTYWPFGTEAAGSDYDTETRRFTGHERDDFGVNTSATLDYMHARYYRGAIGRFLSIDRHEAQIERPQSWDRFQYASNNPLSRLDPDGLRDIYVAFWNAKWPYVYGEGSVGHVAAFELDGRVILSQFPNPHGSEGANVKLRYKPTKQKENGRLPDAVFRVHVPNDEKFDAVVRAKSAPNAPTWYYQPVYDDETNCVQSVACALEAGGVPAYDTKTGTPPFPGDLQANLRALATQEPTQGQQWSVTSASVNVLEPSASPHASFDDHREGNQWELSDIVGGEVEIVVTVGTPPQ